MEKDDELSPSKLYANYKVHRTDESSIDHETLLQNLFSLLSTLGDLESVFNPRFLDDDDKDDHVDNDHYCDVVDWLFKNLIENSPADGIDIEEGTLLCEWSSALQYIHDLIPHIAPLELHILASQSIVFAEGPTPTYRILCLLLCSYSLQQCPLSLKKRWKRWQSIVCETLRIFQEAVPLLDIDHGNGIYSGAVVSLLVRHIVPSCLHAIDQLPIDGPYHVALFSAIVGTSSDILDRKIVQYQDAVSNGTKSTIRAGSGFSNLLSIIYDAVQQIRRSFDRFGLLSETTLWIAPTLRRPIEEHRNEDVDFLMNRDNLAWWANPRDEHGPEERVASMDTAVNPVGLALLAMKALQERPMVYHPNFVWSVWFFHVIVLFRKSGDVPFMLEQPTTLFLESLVSVVPKESLLVGKIVYGKPDAPVEMFHLLSNRLMARAQTSHPENEATAGSPDDDKEAEFNRRSQRTVALTKALMSRFTTISQVQIVAKLCKDCSTPGLQARFLDLLRPVILVPDHETETLLWELLVSIVDDLFKKYWDRKQQSLVDIDSLINRDVEVSIGAITMIQMWAMVDGKTFPSRKKAIEDDLRGFHEALKELFDRWLEDPSTTPECHHRLFLLDISIENTLRSLLTCS